MYTCTSMYTYPPCHPSRWDARDIMPDGSVEGTPSCDRDHVGHGDCHGSTASHHRDAGGCTKPNSSRITLILILSLSLSLHFC